jgi:hypothetical protein
MDNTHHTITAARNVGSTRRLLLSEAQNTIRDLQTKLAHERLGNDEVLQAIQRAELEK